MFSRTSNSPASAGDADDDEGQVVLELGFAALGGEVGEQGLLDLARAGIATDGGG